MSEKRRFLGTLLGNTVDRFPYFDLDPDEAAMDRWRREGLPGRKSVSEVFHLETHHSVGLTLRSYPYFQGSTDLLQDPASFNRHYQPDEPSRYAKGWVERGRRLAEEGRVLYVDASGGGLLQMLGVSDWDSLVTACRVLVREPERVEELVHRTTDFYCVCLERVLARVSVDYASFYEPIASNIGPVISPAMFERFAIPGYRKVISLLNRFHVPLRILCTTGGDLNSLLPSLIDAGINGLWISNIMSARMEYQTIRRRFGREVALIGGIDSTALSGDEASVRRAVEKTVPPLLESGRYLPCLDDRPRADIPYALYQTYRRILEEIAQKG